MVAKCPRILTHVPVLYCPGIFTNFDSRLELGVTTMASVVPRKTFKHTHITSDTLEHSTSKHCMAMSIRRMGAVRVVVVVTKLVGVI